MLSQLSRQNNLRPFGFSLLGAVFRAMEHDAQCFEVHVAVESQGRGGLHAHMLVGMFFV